MAIPDLLEASPQRRLSQEVPVGLARHMLMKTPAALLRST